MRLALLTTALLLIAAARLAALQEPARAGGELTASERSAASELAQKALERARLRTPGPLYLVGTELLRDKRAEERGVFDRQAMVTHYRYDGDLTILTRVNVTRGEVERIDTVPHLPAALAPEEFRRAKDLALADVRVQRALARFGEVTIEPLAIRTASRDDPIFGHRLVRLLFRKGPDYLREPVVVVDLTTAQVILEPPGPVR